MQSAASGTWDKLEQVFEDRVAKALARLGFHTSADLERLVQRVDALSQSVNALLAAGEAAPAQKARPTRKASPKSRGDADEAGASPAKIARKRRAQGATTATKTGTSAKKGAGRGRN